MLQAKLRVVGGRHHGKLIPLATKKFLIGREHDCQLRPNSELVSRHHCCFVLDDFSVRVRDLGSTNGTLVNDQRVQGEVHLNSGDRVRVGKLDFEVLIGEAAIAAATPSPSGDSSHLLSRLGIDASAQETAPLRSTDTSFEIPVPAIPEDTGSSILPTETVTPLPNLAAVHSGDSTVVFTPGQSPGQSPGQQPPGQAMGQPTSQPPDPYPLAAPYQMPYQPAYPYMPPGMGYQAPLGYPPMHMGYPQMYPQMGQIGMYPSAPAYAPVPQAPPQAAPAQSAPAAEPDSDESSMPTVRLPDPKTTGAKSPSVPAPAPAAPAAEGDASQAGAKTDEWSKKPEDQNKKEEKKPDVIPSQSAADILRNYTQRRPV